jgi:LacI family transcriptional regulator
MKPAHIKTLKERGISVGLLSAPRKSSSECSVTVNDVFGAEIAIEHLVELGHQHIAWVCGPESIPQVIDRTKGVAIAAKHHKIQVDTVRSPSMKFEGGIQAAEEILAMNPRPTGIFCANDLLALGLMRTLLAAGVKIPEEISIIGYDDIEFARTAAVPLSSIIQPAYQLGYTATQLLLSECETIETHAHQDVRFQPEIIARASTGPVKS